MHPTQRIPGSPQMPQERVIRDQSCGCVYILRSVVEATGQVMLDAHQGYYQVQPDGEEVLVEPCRVHADE